MLVLEVLPSIFKDNLPGSEVLYQDPELILFSYRGSYLIACINESMSGDLFLDICMADLDPIHRVICELEVDELELNLNPIFKCIKKHGLENRLPMVVLLDKFLPTLKNLNSVKISKYGKLYIEAKYSSVVLVIELSDNGDYYICNPEEYGLGSFFVSGVDSRGSFEDEIESIVQKLESVSADIKSKIISEESS